MSGQCHRKGKENSPTVHVVTGSKRKAGGPPRHAVTLGANSGYATSVLDPIKRSKLPCVDCTNELEAEAATQPHLGP